MLENTFIQLNFSLYVVVSAHDEKPVTLTSMKIR